MGYSRYTLWTEPSTEFHNVRKYITSYFGIDFAVTGVGEHTLKWARIKENISDVSKVFPDVLVIIERENEEGFDMERYYARNGNVKSIKATVAWPNPPKV